MEGVLGVQPEFVEEGHATIGERTAANKAKHLKKQYVAGKKNVMSLSHADIHLSKKQPATALLTAVAAASYDASHRVDTS